MEAIRTERQPACLACGATGAPLHTALTDRLYGAPGTWDVSRCTHPGCGLLWLDPMPQAQDMALAYANYYTHGAAAGPGGTRVRRRNEGAYFLHLRDRPPGRLLEVGCGEGSRLRAFRALGWRVTGQETDPRAADAARGGGDIEVLEGALADLRLPGDSYDAIVMNHVLEHVRDPRALLLECRRLLAPGGVLAAVTPNAAGLGHALFGRAWRGLEPPRHLFVYTPGALRRLAEGAGFARFDVFSQAVNAAGTVIQESLRPPRRVPGAGGGLWAPLVWPAAQLFRAVESAWLRVDPGAGEEVVLLAYRDAADG